MTIRASFRTKLAVAFLGLSIATAAIVLHFAWRRARQSQLEGLQSMLAAVTGAVAPEIDGDVHARLAGKSRDDVLADSDYRALRALGARVKAAHPGFNEVFTISFSGARDAEHGRLVLTAFDRDIGRDYDVGRFPAMRRARAVPCADDDVCPDEYGISLSGYAPIRDRAGTTVGLLGIDVDGSTVDAMRGHLLGILALGALGAVLLGGALALFFAAHIHRPVRALSAGMNRVAEGDFAARVTWKSGDEFERLASQFNVMAAGLEERRRLKHALELAMEIQQSLLPPGPPEASGLDIAGFSDYCDETGGDYFDYPAMRTLAGGRIALTIGDVTGHGIGAALMMASGRAALRSQSERDEGPAHLIGVVNRHLARDATAGKFMTLFYGILDPIAGVLAFANAGQGGCFVVRASTGKVEELEAGGPPAGVIDGIPFAESRIEGLANGDVVVLGTDGIWETVDAGGEPFGMERFERIARENVGRSAAEIAEVVRLAVEAHRGTGPQTDDVTLVVAKLDASRRATSEPKSLSQ